MDLPRTIIKLCIECVVNGITTKTRQSRAATAAAVYSRDERRSAVCRNCQNPDGVIIVEHLAHLWDLECMCRLTGRYRAERVSDLLLDMTEILQQGFASYESALDEIADDREEFGVLFAGKLTRQEQKFLLTLAEASKKEMKPIDIHTSNAVEKYFCEWPVPTHLCFPSAER